MRKQVYVLSKKGEPAMPFEAADARFLLKTGKAKVMRTTPFLIKLLVDDWRPVEHLKLSIDTGSAKIGSAVVNEKNEVLYMSEIEVRNDIAGNMTERAKHRRSRRFRNTPYRAPRWLNRKNNIRKDRFSPTMTSKIQSHLKEIKFVCKMLPISELTFETGTFDPHALKNPQVLEDPLLYQRGTNYGYANTRQFVLARDGYKCQNKCCKAKDKRLEVHHLVYRENDGGDEPENLLTLCKSCHDGVHDGSVVLGKLGKKKGALNHATQMNSIRVQLLWLFPEARETFGYITKENRMILDLPKEHYFDAVAIAANPNEKIVFKTNEVLLKKCVADGDYQLTKGVRGEKKIPVGKIGGFRKFDKVKYAGAEYFIAGRMSSGYAILMDIEGKKAALKPIPKFTKMRRISARKSWIMQVKHCASSLISPSLKA